MKRLLSAAVLAAVILLSVSGCTERERSGYSAIPQNSPGAWEMSPWENVRN